MTGAAIVQMVLFLLNIVLGQFKQSSTATEAEQLAITGIEAAIAKLQEVHGTDVTFQQLESLRVQKTW
jgi:hypothetical protein